MTTPRMLEVPVNLANEFIEGCRWVLIDIDPMGNVEYCV